METNKDKGTQLTRKVWERGKGNGCLSIEYYEHAVLAIESINTSIFLFH